MIITCGTYVYQSPKSNYELKVVIAIKINEKLNLIYINML
jgi:hypothetical protein